ncbi:hypothetical protein HCH_03507 [Hahella chejuensis KCTC 2396]|uniref:Uncharacterized protein n=1 Tax=Hahella chejuensis (strain KCTC 2396) TaxID=349521 RepID=Q2SGH1_HAHCH|nr:hypothetical protein [Hahella chejuensis]ABC30253.1 hypothetical protein HCH_03507 [Hahella chejuensis KCTC 2396]
MKDVRKSALWALISIPITLFAVYFSYAMLHGSFTFLVVFLAPGGLIVSLLENVIHTSLPLIIAGILAQYLGYFAIIHGLRKLVSWLRFRSRKEEPAN